MGKAARPPAQKQATPPPNQRELIQVAADHAQAGRLDQARRLYEQVLRASPRDVNALYGLAELLGRLNQTRQAIELLGRLRPHLQSQLSQVIFDDLSSALTHSDVLGTSTDTR